MTLSHRGYDGTIAEEDGRLIVAIAGIDDMITAEAGAVACAQEVFRDLVEDYLATCAEIGKDPQLPGGRR